MAKSNRVQKPERDPVHQLRFLSKTEQRDAMEHARDCMRRFVDTLKREKAAEEHRARLIRMRAAEEYRLKKMIEAEEQRQKAIMMLAERAKQRDEASTSAPAVYRPPVYLFTREEDMQKEVRELTFHVPLPVKKN